MQKVTEWHIQRATVESDITAITFSPSDGTKTSPSDLDDSVAITGVPVPESPTILLTELTSPFLISLLSLTLQHCSVDKDKPEEQ